MISVGFLKKLLELWNASGNQRLINLKSDIASDIRSLGRIKGMVDCKSKLVEKSAAIKPGQMRRLNSGLIRVLSRLLAEEKGEEKLQLRKLLRLAMEINPRDRDSIIPHLRYAYTGLESLEGKIEKLMKLVERENTSLDKQEIERIISEEQRTIQEIETSLSEIDNELKQRLLMDYFGHETRFRCPECRMRFIRVDKVQVRENPRLHSHTFHCHFCGHIEEATDVSLNEVEKRWS